MPKVLCKLDNASESINGVRFVAHKKGMISEEISEEQAKRFARIPGYEIVSQPSSSQPNPGAGGGRGRGRGSKAGADGKTGTEDSSTDSTSETTPPAGEQPTGDGAGDPPPTDPDSTESE